MTDPDKTPAIIFKCEGYTFELVAEDTDKPSMRRFDRPKAIVAELTDEHAAILARRPNDPERFMKVYSEHADPFKSMPKPSCPQKLRDWRKNAREDFHFKCAVLLTTLIFDGQDGRDKVTPGRATEIWVALRESHPGAEKVRGYDTHFDIWKNRDRGRGEGAGAWKTRSYILTLLSGMILDDEDRHAARVAKARTESPVPVAGHGQPGENKGAYKERLTS